MAGVIPPTHAYCFGTASTTDVYAMKLEEKWDIQFGFGLRSAHFGAANLNGMKGPARKPLKPLIP
jgi:hypothetical protein